MPVNSSQMVGSVSSYQTIDGSNFTVAGVEHKIYTKNASAGIFMGAGTDFKSEVSYIVDFKGSMNYDKNGVLNQNLRIRNNIGPKNTRTTQFRYSPLTMNVPLNDNTSIYVNPHYSGKYNYKTDKWTNSAGVFTGLTWKPDKNKNTSVSLEVQRYNLQDIKDNSSGNWSVNAIVSCKI